MDENNNITNSENGFIMRDNPEQTEQDSKQPETDSTYRWSRPDLQSQTQSQNQTQSQTQTQSQPADNTYRFQNTEKKPQKKKTGNTMPKMIAAAAVFGVVAAICFAGVTALFHSFTGGGNSTSDKISSTNEGTPVAVVSGGAATPYDVSGIVERVMPSIVAITEKSTQTSYFGQSYSSTGAGSGFIVKQDDKQLLIVTNNHVVEGADKISVQFNDGEVADAEIKGTSASNDLAVITVALEKLKDSTKKSIRVASLGNSDEAKVGQMVIAIGNALGYGQSVTVGYVSAKNREVSSSDGNGKTTNQVLMQTDAAINPGNSGGALIDTNGNVIGINSSKYMSYGSTNVEGMGYAIPMSDAVSVINQLMDREVLKDNERGYLGITGMNISESVSETYGIPEGVRIVSVSETGAANKAGIKQGDIITKIGGQSVKTIEEVREIVNNTKAGTDMEITVKRSDDGEYKEKTVIVVLKNKDTLEGLETEPQSDSGEDSYNNGEDDSQIVPWGGSGY